MAAIRSHVKVRMQRAGGRVAELVTFTGIYDGLEHFACVFGEPRPEALVRLHSECLTGDVFASTRCDCGAQLDEALRRLAAEDGVLLYMRQEGRGIGLYNKIDAYSLQDHDIDTFRANELLGRGRDERDYGAAAEMLRALGVERVRLLTNNPDKCRQLEENGISIVAQERTGVYLTPDNRAYLADKAAQSGHLLPGMESLS
ncbi:GTP cyclohydrolase II RibA [Umezawaea tangerina]|uniref:GTP cyclohydrolase II n=1 Tax=Umezawaea tangerina TaxID=84725 RepID=A0A2T0SZW4_9PSEU|nr:GTP cyclohydrolase II RibA [Umezawaea tangerina]PRY38903.1 GTP cyclohydrolase II [Umezawaea tangerina]